MKYPALPPCEPLNGDEQIALDGRALATVQDFWRWAYSNMNDNASRGRFAEYIVAAALGCTEGTRREWDAYDVLWHGIKVEVKSSAYIQSWGQNQLSRIVFGVQPTLDWDPETGQEGKVRRRQADVYVFCVETCQNQDPGNPNPLDLAQWDFYVMATSTLNTLGNQKTISLVQLRAMNATLVKDVFALPEAIEAVLQQATITQPEA